MKIDAISIGSSPVYNTLLPLKNDPFTDEIDFEKLNTQLLDFEIIDITDMHEYLKGLGKIDRFKNEVYLCVLENEIKAVFKPKSQEDMSSAITEVVAYRASEWLAGMIGKHLVPPTVIKDYAGRSGSVQYFVESELDLWRDDDRKKGFDLLSKRDLSNAIAFLFIFGQWDVHPGNFMMEIDSSNKTRLTLIDNEGIENKKITDAFGQRPFVAAAWSDKDITYDMILKKPSFDEFCRGLKDFDLPMGRLKSMYKYISEEGKRDVYLKVMNGGLYNQYHKFNRKAFPCSIDQFSKETTEAFKSLDIDTLKEIFDPLVSFDNNRFNDSFIEAILTRRDILINFSEEQGSFIE